jgi:hypothetical protein
LRPELHVDEVVGLLDGGAQQSRTQLVRVRARYRGLHDMSGGFTLLNITQDSASHLVASLKDNHGGYAEISLELASTEPPVVKRIFGHPVPPPASERSPSENGRDLVGQVKGRAANLLQK